MQAIILASEAQKAELMTGAPPEGDGLVFIEDPSVFGQYPGADLYVDLLFEERGGAFAGLPSCRPLVVGSVCCTLDALGDAVARVNAWPTMLLGAEVEASGPVALQEPVQRFFALFGRRLAWLPDTPGFVTARVVAMIIQEARLLRGEGAASEADIDTAMKLGTNYPCGPFEWERLIGAERVEKLLELI